ncbi:MAG: Vms1/Ankzf1 family peptidyl-tRNA hydrolase [Methanothrix sp.]|nr:Vms1/Ankzf1 family peptidyl-tRNA hydrolase [Methanothrix sp.]
MVDLFGKKKLDDRILELQAALTKLEGEKEELLRTLEKREEKMRRLSSANQAANLALKAAEQNTAALSVPSVPVRTEVEMCVEQKPKARRLSLREMDLLMERLKACRSPRDDLLVAFYPGPVPEDDALPSQIKKAAAAIKSQRGGIILHSPQLFSLQLIPPCPILESYSQEGSAFALDLLGEMRDTPVLVVSAHAGETFLGVALCREGFEAEELVESQVMGKHSKGGWSQKRFERLREEDIKSHVDLVQEKLAALMGKYKTLLKYAVLSGEESLIRQIAPGIGLPVVERRLERHDGRKTEEILEEVYGFTCYRIET